MGYEGIKTFRNEMADKKVEGESRVRADRPGDAGLSSSGALDN